MSQEKLFVTEDVLDITTHDVVDKVVVPKFSEEGIRPVPKSAWELKQEEFEKEWHYGSTQVYLYQGQYFFTGDIDHCGMEDIFFNATKMRDHMRGRGLKGGHMNYNDPPTYENTFDKVSHDKDIKMYGYKTYTWKGGEPMEVNKDGTIQECTDMEKNSEE